MSGKRYYWLRLKDDFFSSKRIKKLRAMAGGDTYLIIYLKMQLLSLKTDGVLTWTGLEDKFADELALDLDEKPDDVAVTLMYLLNTGLAETSDNINFFFPFVVENTGSEGASAQRVREFRNRQALQCNTEDVTTKQICNVEKETEKDKEIEKRDRKKSKKFVPPTLEEVKAYIAEKGYHVDAEFFWNYYDKGQWMRKDGTPVLNWKQTLVTWEKKESEKPEPKKKQYTTAEHYKAPNKQITNNELWKLVDKI